MPSSQSTSKRAIVTPAVILMIACAIAYALYASKPEQAQQVLEQQPMLVDAIEVFRETIQLKIITQGSVVPKTETRLSSEVQGRIIEVAENFVAGGYFKQGEMLLKIDDLEYRTALKRAHASVASSKTRLAEEQGRAEVAYQDWQRNNKGGKRTAKAKSLALRKPQIAEAQANLIAAQADLEKAQENLKRTSISAPYDGLVRSRNVDLGQHVSVGSELGLYFATDSVEVRLPVPEHKLALLDIPAASNLNQKPVLIQLSVSLNNKTFYWRAELSRVESVLDDRTRVLHVVAQVNNPYQLNNTNTQPTSKASASSAISSNPPLRVGTFVHAEIYGKTIENIVRIPHNVLQTDNKVWLVTPEGSMYEQPVEVIANDNEYTYISSGLKDHDKIAMGYVDNSIPGTKVTIAKLIQLPPRESYISHNDDSAVTPPSTVLQSEQVVTPAIDSTLNSPLARDI